MTVPQFVGSATTVVDVPGFSIKELAGNVASKDDRISIAQCNAKAGTQEPWLTLHYDEWICVTRGSIKFQYGRKDAAVSEMTAAAGQTVFIPSGTRFQPQFPEDTEYVPVCMPAFKPDRCIREDELDKEGVAKRLAELHKCQSGNAVGVGACAGTEPVPEILYHMCPKVQWEEAKRKGEAYYPTNYVEDGYYTHATGVPSRLIDTANHFYTDSPGEWVCLQFTRSALKKMGIHTKDEEAMPVGDKLPDEKWLQQKWICPHVIGGLPPNIEYKELPMTRSEDGKFLGIEGI